MTNWKSYKLEELIDKKRGISYGIVQPGVFLDEGGVPVLKVNNLTEKKTSKKDLFRVTKEIESKFSRTRLQGNEILVSLVGSIGHVHKVSEEQIGWNVVRAIGVLPIKEGVNRDWVYWCLKSPDIQSLLINNAVTTVQSTLNIKELKEIEIPYPESTVLQQEIASILSSLDDKIELNLQMNQTLEAMAQAIFKEWFVNFNFPGFDGELVDGLPKGWKISELNEIISFVVDNRGKTPPIIEDGRKGIPLIEVNALINSPVVAQQHLAKKYVDEETYANWFRKGHPEKGDVLFSTVGSIGEMAISFGEQICIAQNIVALRSNFKGYFLYFTLKSIKQNLLSLDISSVQPSIKVPHLLKQEVLVPSNEIINEFENIITPLLKRIFENEMDIRILTQIRDSLLPKLITGKIEIKE